MLMLRFARRIVRIVSIALLSGVLHAQDPLSIDVQLPSGASVGDPSPLQRGSHVQVRSRASAEGKLDGWIDFNRDGDLDDADEQVFAAYPVHGGNNIASFKVPISADPGPSRARFRFSESGGIPPTGAAPDADTETLDVDVVSPSLASGVEAWYAAGQVWVTWTYHERTAPETFEIYRARSPFERVEDAERAGKLFPAEYSGSHLAAEMRDAFGAGAPEHYTVPTDSAGGRKTLVGGQGLFVGTVRSTGEWHYAVVPGGVSKIPEGSLASTPVREIYDPADPPTCHEQASGVVDPVRVTFFNHWGDGGQEGQESRSDYPFFGNAAKRGAPHLFIVMEPLASLPVDTTAPACLAFHSGGARASMWLPGDKNGFRSAGLLPQSGMIVALETMLYQMSNGVPDRSAPRSPIRRSSTSSPIPATGIRAP